MAVRPYLTTGAAIVSAGALIAALPAIVPSPTPPDVKIAAGIPKSPYVDDVKLHAFLQDLVDQFFANGITGATERTLLEIVGADANAAEAITGFFSGIDGFPARGFPELLRQWLIDNTSDPAQEAVINLFFSGGFTELAQQWMLLNNIDPAQDELINGFFDGFNGPESDDYDIPAGFSYLTWQFLISRTADPNQQAALNQFFGGGATEVTQQFLVNQTADPNQQALINGYFDGFTGPESGDYDIPAGLSYLAWRQLVDNNADPATEQGINAFFGGGATEFTRLFLLSSTAEGSPNADLINAFFAGYPFGEDTAKAGVTGVVHYLIDSLIGGVVPPDPPEPPPAEESFATLSVEDGPSLLSARAGAADLPEANSTIDPDAKTVDLTVEDKVEKAVEPDPADVVTPVAAPAPAVEPAPAPAPAPVETPPAATPVADDGEDDAKEVTEEELDSGNKVEPETILLETGTGGGGTAWDETVKRWQDFGRSLGFGGATTPASTPDAGGDTESAEGAS